MLQSLVILKSGSFFENGVIVDTYLECQMEDGEHSTYIKHPARIFLGGVWYYKTGWDSDRKVIHYRTGVK